MHVVEDIFLSKSADKTSQIISAVSSIPLRHDVSYVAMPTLEASPQLAGEATVSECEAENDSCALESKISMGRRWDCPAC